MFFSLLKLSIPAVLRNPFPEANFLIEATKRDRFFNEYTLTGLGTHRTALVKSRNLVSTWQLAFVGIAIVAALVLSFTHDRISLITVAACIAGIGFLQSRWIVPINTQRNRVDEEINRRTDKLHDH